VYQLFPHFDGLSTIGVYVLDACIGRQIINTLWDSEDLELCEPFLSAFYRTQAIAQLYDLWLLDQWVLLGAGQRKDGVNIQMKESFVQALAGACYLDAGELEITLTRFKEPVGTHFSACMERIGFHSDAKKGNQPITHPTDPKTLLQEITQMLRLPAEYKMQQAAGPKTQKFQSAVRIVLPEPHKPTPWLIGPPAASRSAADQQAADFYLRLMRICVRGGKTAALRPFREPSNAATELIALTSTIVMLVNVQANEKQRKHRALPAKLVDFHLSRQFWCSVTSERASVPGLVRTSRMAGGSAISRPF
jgi:dsRNA-specific ribonuclease